MKHVREMGESDIKGIKLIVLDVDGVLVPRGTKIKQRGNITTLETKKIAATQIEQIKKLYNKGFHININSGRGLYMLQDMFREVLDYISITYENGSATWFKGKIIQHVNSFKFLKNVFLKLKKIKHKNIKGFEPKEFIITIHCTNKVNEIEKVMSKEKELYSIWNSEAYDIGVKKIQVKSVGLIKLISVLKLKKENVLVIGDNYNDAEMMSVGKIAVTADKSRVKGDFYVELEKKRLPADILIERLLEILK
jgi:hydroxymethylpyrimidine pyrophosphatase-like HAD family hydrolase